MMRGIKFMANDKSLVSLALIKTNWEEKQKDFVDILIPFILYSISDLNPDEIVSITDTREKLKTDFGIDLYNNVIETFFKRITSQKYYQNPYLRKIKGVYYRTDQCIDIQSFEEKRQKYSENQNNVLNSFIAFLNNKKVTYESVVAKNELVSYLCKYGHNILRNNISVEENNIWTKRVGEFIEYTYENDENIFNYLKDIAKGGMLSSVYLNSSKNVKPSQKFKNTVIYFDTPLLMYILNYSGIALQKTIQELLDLLHENGAEVYTFEHNLSELESILEAYISRYRKGTLDTSYNFDYLIENNVKPEKIETDIPSLSTMLKLKGIIVKPTPPYDDYWRNIGVINFNHYLSDKIHYSKDTRRDNDVESIAAIYRLRSREEYHRYETCEALFVATNNYLVYHTQKYFKEIEKKKGIPAIVDDTFLTSLLWLKSKNKDDSLPTLKLIADALAAQEPSKSFWDSFIIKIDELQARGEITDDEVIELKYGLFSKKNMFDVTEGDIKKINHETVREVQQMNFRMQHKELLEEKEELENEKKQALAERNNYQDKFEKSYNELIIARSEKYIKKIHYGKKMIKVLSLFIICTIIYFIVDFVTNITGMLSSNQISINLGITAIIIIIGGILKQFFNKLISKQTDKLSALFIEKYIKILYKKIEKDEKQYANDIILYLNNIEKTP